MSCVLSSCATDERRMTCQKRWEAQKTKLTHRRSVCSLSATPPVTPPATSTSVKEIPADSLPDVIISPIAMPEHQCTPLPTTTAVPTSSETPTLTDTASSPFKQLSSTTLRPLDNLTHPLTKEEEECHTHLTKIKVSMSADKATLRCKTRGQPVVYKRIVVPRKSSLLAISPLREKRSKLIAKIRQDVPGSSADDSIKQQSSELKRSSETTRERLLQAAGMERPAISSEQSSALRTRLGLSWNKYRKHSRFLKSIGVIVPSAHMERVIQDSALCGGHQNSQQADGKSRQSGKISSWLCRQ